ncbi:MAG TPA: sigma-70 family RNA polymerase sigma factor [Bacteroidia bacterium]|nr:sigma-70 family RNA polymerase sigma factor [Bacteroidia bacterium]
MAYRDDPYYIERIKVHGDNYAFAALVNKHQTMVYNIALRVTRNREDAEEVAQDAFVKLHKSLSEFRGDSKFTTWMYKITMNLALTRIRKKNLFDGSVDDDHFNEPGLDELPHIELKEQKQLIKTAINMLDETDGLLITLFYMDEQSIDDISAITGLSLSNVKVRLFRARKKLGSLLLQQVPKEEIMIY